MAATLTTEQREKLAKAIIHKPPYCSGILPVPQEDLVIFYGKGKEGRRLDVTHASSDDLQHLSQTCEAATFGMDQEDVLDETYRKAGKLDSTNFAVKLDIDSLGLFEAVRSDLLDGRKAQENVHAELYKLNVYGEGSFFKSHKDTPRSTKMFGSLVVVYPTAHKGGALTMSHEGESWTFDSGEIFAGHNDARIGYVAFFSDVDHEVTLVESGYRVTITYNLYFVDSPVHIPLAPSISPAGKEFKSAFLALLADPTFLPNGGHLGFGMRHVYPLENKPKGKDVLRYMKRCLKGSDADVLRVCKELSLKVELNIMFKDRGELVMLPKDPKLEGKQLDMDDGLCEYLCHRYKARLVGPPGAADGGPKKMSRYPYREVDVELQWVTSLTELNIQKSSFIAYGNQAELSHAYGHIALIVRVGKLGARTTRRAVTSDPSNTVGHDNNTSSTAMPPGSSAENVGGGQQTAAQPSDTTTSVQPQVDVGQIPSAFTVSQVGAGVDDGEAGPATAPPTVAAKPTTKGRLGSQAANPDGTLARFTRDWKSLSKKARK
ncbi:hypothetical protein PHLCEN_2v13230, partial [Hermanssonia centrifuga]